MKTRIRHLWLILLLAFPVWGCAGKWVKEQPPTIAHAHIGHAITGWPTTPGQAGLFEVAEKEARIARDHAEFAVERLDDMSLIKLHTGHVMNAIDPESNPQGPGTGFGLKRSLVESANHITFAAEADDATENTRAFAASFNRDVQVLVQRCDLMLALGEEILGTSDTRDAAALAVEMVKLATIQLDGIGAEGPEDIGVRQLRARIDEMLRQEAPPYRPVPQKYLFGLIRLPGGKWAYSSEVTGPGNKSNARQRTHGGGDY